MHTGENADNERVVLEARVTHVCCLNHTGVGPDASPHPKNSWGIVMLHAPVRTGTVCMDPRKDRFVVFPVAKRRKTPRMYPHPGDRYPDSSGRLDWTRSTLWKRRLCVVTH